MTPIALALHGGAGTFTEATLAGADREEILAALARALDVGARLLERGETARSVVRAVVVALEDDPVFNAGRGAVFTADGTHELDAALMEGHTSRAGAVCGVVSVKNPVLLADAVLEHSGHVLLQGDGAERFADVRPEIERVPNSYFSTEARRAQLEEARAFEALHGKGAYFGTVGAVALDERGHLAAATSTGGLSNKRYGRVGDSPILGAGTFASNEVAVSATGSGEFFLRTVAAHSVAARVRFAKMSLERAAHEVVFEDVAGLGGDGGLIALDRSGAIAMPCNISSLARAALHPGGRREVELFTGR